MINQGFLQLPDDAFWAPKLDLNEHVSKLILSDVEGIFLDAPREVDLRVRDELPVAALAALSNERVFDWTFREHTLLAACDVERFRCLADQLAPFERPVVRGPARKLTPEMRGGGIGEARVIPARRRLALPWEPGVWQLVLLTRDRRSEPVRVVLRSGDSAPPPAAPLPGAKLALTPSGQGLETVLELALKVHATKSALQSPGGGDAAVPVTLVVTGHDQPIPYVVRRAVPGRWGPAGEPEHVVAATRIALKELVPAGVQDSALYVWAFAGDQVSAPVRVALP